MGNEARPDRRAAPAVPSVVLTGVVALEPLDGRRKPLRGAVDDRV